MARMKYEFKPGDIIIIDWLDAHSVDEWTSRDELPKKIEPKMCRTIGFYHTTTRHSVVVTATYGLDTPDDDVAGVWTIPKGMVRRVEVIHRGE